MHPTNRVEVVLNDAAKGTYAKLMLSDDAKNLFGGILIGELKAS